MKQTLGFGMVLAVAVAAMRMGGGASAPYAPQPAGSPTNATFAPYAQTLPTSSKPPTQAAGYVDGCAAFEAAPASSKYPYESSAGAANAVLDKFFGDGVDLSSVDYRTVHYAIALMPDPVHTNLSLMFDRQAALIQQAAQDEGYTYDSSWLPWKTASASYPQLADQQIADNITGDREACPGILLFRKSVGPGIEQAQEDAYKEGLVALVVGEQPTGGINHNQWTNAVFWLDKHASAMETAAPSAAPPGSSMTTPDKWPAVPRALRILGPTFTGSLVSLERELNTVGGTKTAGGTKILDAAKPNFPNAKSPIRVLSGTVAGCSSIRWFQQRLTSLRPGSDAVFGSFSENDELRIDRFLRYLGSQGTRPADTAILSEDETAYALANGQSGVSLQKTADGSPQKSVDSGSCDAPRDLNDQPVRLFYPRDISSLRIAYEKQSVFSASNPSARASHPILREDNAGQANESTSASDTISAYSGEATAIEQEAILYGIVSNLLAHRTHYIVLRCTNPLDYLFLIRFFHRAYPEGRIVTIGADLLFRREIDTTEYRGVLALSNYPLLPRNQHWTALSPNGQPPVMHAHRVFESNSEGTYIAARYLFGTRDDLNPVAATNPLSLNLKPNIPEFANPFWICDPGVPVHWMQAPTWLATVGRDGYWPIAVLDPAQSSKVDRCGQSPSQVSHPPVPNQPLSTMVQAVSSAGVYYKYVPAPAGRAHFNWSLFIRLPTAWKVCTACAFLLILYQALGLVWGPGLTSSGFFAIFRPVLDPSQAVLLGINSALAAVILLSLCTLGFSGSAIGELFGGTLAKGIFAVVCTLALLILVIRFQKTKRLYAAISFVLTLLIFATASYTGFWLHLGTANEVPFLYRLEHLSSGVSPLLPVLFLLAGFYLWTWQALAGNSLLCSGRPLLPALPGQSQFRISDKMGKRILWIARPLNPIVLLLPGYAAFVTVWLFRGDLPLLGLESHAYAVWINLWLLFAFALTSAEAVRLYFTWVELKRLLSALDRLPLRRTFARLDSVDSHSLWSVSGNVQRIQFSFFSRQLDADRRLSDLLPASGESLYKAVASGTHFAEVYAPRVHIGPRWEDEVERPLEAISRSGRGVQWSSEREQALVRKDMNQAVADVLENILFDAWSREERSLSLDDSAMANPKGAGEDKGFDMKLSNDLLVRAAEEFVCFHYLAFIQNILVRMRTMVLSMVCVFVSVCLAISFYPFVPRSQIGLWMLADLLPIAAAVIYVYAGMERDKTLSYVTNTNTRLTAEFYLKTAGFLAGPILGLLTTQFPAISESILGLLQPGALK
jgi:hypothetical protein